MMECTRGEILHMRKAIFDCMNFRSPTLWTGADLVIYRRPSGIESVLGERERRGVIATVLIAVMLTASICSATPPEYSTFGRDQKAEYSPKPSELLAILVVYIGQGDGMLIQLPTKGRYDPDPGDSDSATDNRVHSNHNHGNTCRH